MPSPTPTAVTDRAQIKSSVSSAMVSALGLSWAIPPGRDDIARSTISPILDGIRLVDRHRRVTHG
jgi:hypothetical protein